MQTKLLVRIGSLLGLCSLLVAAAMVGANSVAVSEVVAEEAKDRSEREDDLEEQEYERGGHETRIEGPGRRHLRMRKRAGMLKGKERFLRFSKDYYQTVRDPHAAIGFAALGIKEKYRREGKPLEAIPELQKILESTKDRGARNIILFTIRQVYDHERDREGAERINTQILNENLAVIGK